MRRVADTNGVMGEDLAGQEGVVFREGSVVKDEEELYACIEGLDGVRDAPGSVS